MRPVLVVLGAALLVPLGAGAQTGGYSWTGTWSTTYGQVTLKQTGSTVTGTYTLQSGRIAGTVAGNVLRGTWNEEPTRKPPGDAGELEFTMSADGRSFSGRWCCNWLGDWKTDWSGSRPTAATAGDVQGAKSLKIALFHKQYVPLAATVANGARIEVCNRDEFNHIPFSFNKYNRYDKVLIRPGKCWTWTARNPTGRPTEVKLYDAIHSQERMILTVLP